MLLPPLLDLLSAEEARAHAALEEARVLAHDLNNALSPVVGLAGLLALDPVLAGSPTASRYVTLIAEAGAEAARKVARLQQVTRLDTPTTVTPAGHELDRSSIPPAYPA